MQHQFPADILDKMATDRDPNWIWTTMQSNPCRPVTDDDGELTGDWQMPLARLSFVNVFRPGKPIMVNGEPQGTPKYNVKLLFPYGTDLSALAAAVMEFAKSNFPGHFQHGANGAGLKLPFVDQATKLRLRGFTRDAVVVTPSSKFRPAVVDRNLNPIEDETRVYAGCWGFAQCNMFKYDMGVNKGVSFGLQSIMVVEEDRKISGGAPDPKNGFAGVNVTTDSTYDPAGQFGHQQGLLNLAGQQTPLNLTGGQQAATPAEQARAAALKALGLG